MSRGFRLDGGGELEGLFQEIILKLRSGNEWGLGWCGEVYSIDVRGRQAEDLRHTAFGPTEPEPP